MHEVAVRNAVRRGDFNVLFGNFLRIGGPGQEHRQPGPCRRCAELPPGPLVSSFQMLAGFLECSIIAHGSFPFALFVEPHQRAYTMTG